MDLLARIFMKTLQRKRKGGLRATLSIGFTAVPHSTGDAFMVVPGPHQSSSARVSA